MLNYFCTLWQAILGRIRPQPAGVNVWEMQRHLMSISGQHLPDGPAMTHGLLLYLALTSEELAETFRAATKAMSARVISLSADHQVAELIQEMTVAHSSMRSTAMRLRLQLAKITPAAINWHMTTRDAAEILDGITDVMVTTAGMALASGLPGEAAYSEVVTSNQSKANPGTGVIDKDRSGKWIKGPNYRPPNLVAVLDAHVIDCIMKQLDAGTDPTRVQPTPPLH